jgi:hypothetical protein
MVLDDDRGEHPNALGLSPDQLKLREIDYIDILEDEVESEVWLFMRGFFLVFVFFFFFVFCPCSIFAPRKILARLFRNLLGVVL